MIKKIISYILLFFLIVIITISSSLLILSNSIFDEKYIISVLEKQEYYDNIYGYIMETFKDNTIQSGLEYSVLDNIITKDMVKNDINILVRGLYNGTKIEIDSQIIEERLKENIDNIIKKNNKDITANEQEEINIYIKTIEDIYKDGILITEHNIKDIQSLVIKIIYSIEKAEFITYVVTILTLIFFIVLNKKESLKYLAISLMSSGTLLIIPEIVEKTALSTKNIVLLNKTLSKVFIYVLEDTVTRFMIVGILVLAVGLLLNLCSFVRIRIIKDEEIDKKSKNINKTLDKNKN